MWHYQIFMLYINMYALAVYVYVCVYVYVLLLIQMYLDISATYLRNYMSASLAGYVCVCIYVCVLLLIQMYLDISANISEIQMKMLNGSLYYLRNIVQNWPKSPQNAQSRGRPNLFVSLVTTTVISRYSCKIWRECNFSQVIVEYTQNRPKKILRKAPSKGLSAVKFFGAHWLSE